MVFNNGFIFRVAILKKLRVCIIFWIRRESILWSSIIRIR